MNLRIVDAHHHLWDLDACNYPWLAEKGVRRFFGDPAPIQKNYVVTDLRRDARRYELGGSVHVQVGVAEGDELKETAWLQQTGEREGLPSAIIAYGDLSKTDIEPQLGAQLQYSRVRGIRQIVGRSVDEDAVTGSGALLDNPQWRANLGQLRDLGLSFDLQLIPQQVAHAADVIGRVDGIRVALCHCGSPWDQSPSGINSWRDGLRRLASIPGMYCKLSGFGMFDPDWTVDGIRPLVESCIECFGAERCMFGSNFPVDKLHRDYTSLWRAYEEIAAGLSDTEQNRLFVGTATDFYRL